MRADTDTDDEAKASSVACLDACQGIFHHRGSGGSNIESARRCNEDGRIGLARQLEGLGVYSIDDGIEEHRDASRLEYRPGVSARRDEGRPDAVCT